MSKLSEKAKNEIAKRIRGMADFSSERDVTIVIQESALNEENRQYINMIARFKMSAKEFRNFNAANLDNVERAEKRQSDAVSINWYGKSHTRRNEVDGNLM